MASISGREEYTDPAEKFENVTMMLFQPMGEDRRKPGVRLFNARAKTEFSEHEYFAFLREIYNRRNPNATIGEDAENPDYSDSQK